LQVVALKWHRSSTPPARLELEHVRLELGGQCSVRLFPTTANLSPGCPSRRLAQAEGLNVDVYLVEVAREALVPTYLTAARTPARAGRSELVLTGLTDAGRRATGL
jgi:hypothetical protein